MPRELCIINKCDNLATSSDAFFCQKHYERAYYRGRHADAELMKTRYALRKARLEKYRPIVYDAYGSKCACCGETNPSFLQLDHVNNDGYKDQRKRNRNRADFYKAIIRDKFPPIYQLLCANCNWSKAQNSGVCHHKSATQE